MLKLSCLCGQIRIEARKRPAFINECNCTFCRKSGVHWAYFHPSEVSVEGTTKGYRREDKDDPAAELQFCPNCGSTTHFTLTPSAVARFGNSQLGVNVRLADESDLSGIELRYPDGHSWSGNGGFTYVREPRIFGQ
ncbi:MAG: GFA family protein [Rhodospirillales bacterium]|nr:GFA family protein [Rhodospirillales bacterium]